MFLFRSLSLPLLISIAASGQSLFNRNLIQNPGAEAGSAMESYEASKVSIPNWTTTGTMTAARYDGSGFIESSSYGPRDRGVNYFSVLDEGNTSTATQTIDLSAAAVEIDAGRVRFYLEGYVGGPMSVRGGVRAIFLDASGRTLLESFASAPLEEEFSGGQLLLRTANGFLLPNTRSVRIVLELKTASSGFGWSGADALALSLATEAVIGQNLVVNGDAETDEAEPSQNTWKPISGWNTPTGMMAVTYYGARLEIDNAALPDNRGRSLFGAYFGTAAAFQTIDVALARERIDAGGVGYQLSGYLGGFEDSNDSGKLTLSFLDANGKEISKAEVGPVTAVDRGKKSGLLRREGEGSVPAGTRQLRLTLTLLFTGEVTSGMYAYADNVSLVLTASASSVTLNKISNSASGASGAVAAGEMVTLAVSGVTLDARARMQLDSAGLVRKDLAGVKVYFDGTQAPILYVQSSEIGVIVPFDVDGRSSTQVRVEYLGVRSNTVATPVVRTAPGVFTQEGGATGRGLVYGDTWVLNSSSSPAARGSVVTIMWTGGGQTNPTGIDGRIETQSLPRVAQTVSVSIGGQNAEVSYAGAVFHGWAGLLMVQAKVPSAAASGDAVPVTVSVGGGTSQAGVTMAVR